MSAQGEQGNAEADLMQRVASGDPEACANLFDRFGAILFGLVVRMLGSRADAEDVLQEAFREIWQGEAVYDVHRGRLLPWLAQLTRSRALDRLRAPAQSGAGRTAVAAEAKGTDTDSDQAPSEPTAMVRHIIAALPEAERDALLLAYLDGLTQSEIAARLDAPLGLVKSNASRGLIRLRELLTAAGCDR